MTSSRKALIILGAIALIVVVFSSFGSLPSAASLVSGAETSRSTAATLENQVRAARAALSDPETFADALADARTSVPPTPRLGQLITELETLAVESGLQWVAGTPSRSADGQEAWSLEMKVLGPPTSVVAFLDQLQSLPRLVTVDTLSIQSPTGADTATTLTARFYFTPGDLQAFTDEEREAIQTEIDGLAAAQEDAS